MRTGSHARSTGNAAKINDTVVTPLVHFGKTKSGPGTSVRRQLLASLSSLGFFLGMSVAAFAQDERPNILLIVADDMGYADMGAFGGEIETPNLDALAEQGVRFTQFMTSASCSPTRSMMLTGTDNHIAGLGSMAETMAANQAGNPGYEGVLNDRVAPFPALLQAAGYNTFMAGKWHMGEEPDQWPVARGFTRDLTLLPGGGSHLEDMWGTFEGVMPYTLNGHLLTALRPGFHSSVDYTDAIISNIEEFRDEDKPFFAYLAYQAPHDPLQPPFEWRDHYSGRYDQGYDATRADRIARMQDIGIITDDATVFPRLPSIPAWVDLTEEERRTSARKMELYAASVSHMDAQIGKLTDYLRATGEYDNTLIIFLSDNGPEGLPLTFGEQWDNSRIEDWGRAGTYIKYGSAWAQVSAGPFRMFKGYMSEGGIRGPMIVAGEGVTEPGRMTDALAHVMDIPATILDAAGVEHPDTFEGKPVAAMQGMSLAPLLDSTSESVRAPTDWIGWELVGNRAVKMGDWKLLSLCEPAGTGDWQLYDIRKDPAEMNDLSAVHPEIHDQMVGHWDDYVSANNVILPDQSMFCQTKK